MSSNISDKHSFDAADHDLTLGFFVLRFAFTSFKRFFSSRSFMRLAFNYSFSFFICSFLSIISMCSELVRTVAERFLGGTSSLTGGSGCFKNNDKVLCFEREYTSSSECPIESE